MPAPVPRLLCASPQLHGTAAARARLGGTLGGLRGAQVRPHRAAGRPGLTVAPCRGAEMRSQWVFWSLPASSRRAMQQLRCRWAPQIPAPAPRLHGTAGISLRHPGCAAPPGCSWAFVPAQHIGISSCAAEIGRSREAAAAIFNLPDQHPATSTHLGTATRAALRVPPLHKPAHASHSGDRSHQPTPVALPAAAAAGTYR